MWIFPWVIECSIILWVRLGHYSDVIMGAMAFQITRLTIVYSTVYWGADQRKHQSSASLALREKFTSDRWIPAQRAIIAWIRFHLMTSSCNKPNYAPPKPANIAKYASLDTSLVNMKNIGNRTIIYNKIGNITATHPIDYYFGFCHCPMWNKVHCAS